VEAFPLLVGEERQAEREQEIPLGPHLHDLETWFRAPAEPLIGQDAPEPVVLRLDANGIPSSAVRGCGQEAFQEITPRRDELGTKLSRVGRVEGKGERRRDVEGGSDRFRCLDPEEGVAMGNVRSEIDEGLGDEPT